MKRDKWEMWEAQDGICSYCGKWMQPCDIECHVHHALVFKSDVGRKQQNGIDDEINLMLVHANGCHDALQSDREWAREFQEALWGEGAVAEYIQKMRPRTAVRREQ